MDAFRGFLSKGGESPSRKRRKKLNKSSVVRGVGSGRESPTFPRWRMTFMNDSDHASSTSDPELFCSSYSIHGSHDFEATQKTFAKRPSRVSHVSNAYRGLNRNFSVGKSIHLAALAGDLPEVKRLLKNGADIHKKDHLGKTPLMCAALAGSLAVVQVLIQEGADVTCNDNRGDTTLHTAIQAGNEDVIKSLLQSSDIDINMIGSGGFSPLQLAAQSDQAKLCTLLADHGAYLDSSRGNSLTLAVLKGSKNAVECLFNLSN
ncbi:hypothetical protein OS493_034088 [Desmophyllum pertusum]|uniref:Uncharacterized protein n=1 Tax=Desmophyllum pertusum TaxID=174260 RepID=A0A9W9YIV0_9CNID|nr:hypothetical protein OS493_034088 [Desmophyllum pertusum]